MTTKIIKATTKGQVTLPKTWRNQFKTDDFLLQIKVDQIIIKPVHLEELETEEIIFDAERDNGGKGVSPDEMIRLLKKIKHG